MPILPARLLLFLLLVCAPFACSQTYTSILVFGDSLSDTGNDAHLTQSQFGVRVPSPLFGYTDGRFTDGTDTAPAATLYSGVWIEQLAATFPAKPAVTASLDGGTNYAYGFAFTGTGTSALTLAANISVNVDNVGQQVTDYLTAHPTVPANTLVVVWGGANDVLNATSTTAITTAAAAELTAIQRLITAGATDILIANLPPLGDIPRFNTTANAPTVTAGSQAFNASLAAGIAALPAANSGKTLNLKPFDVYSLFSSVIAAPSANALINVTGKSQGDLTINPDRYFFWDDLHPTTTVHHLLAVAAAALVAPPPPAPSISATLSPASVTVASGSTATSTLTVTPAGGFSGSVTITCGSLPAFATCNTGSTPPVTFSTSQTFAITIATNGSNSAAPAGLLVLGTSGPALLAAALGLLALVLLRPLAHRRRLHPGLFALLVTLSLASALGLSGCGGANHKTAVGTYTVPLTITPSTGSAVTANFTLIVQ